MELTTGRVSSLPPLLYEEPYSSLHLTPSSTIEENEEQVWQDLSRFYAENEQTIERAITFNVAAGSKDADPSELNIAIDTFVETTKVILDGLVMLGNIHPILGVAIFAFHSVISLDLSRRDNNKKVIAVKLQMQNMMCTMFQLRRLKHVHVQGEEKLQQRAQLQRLIKVIAEDITACGSDLNYYMDRKFIAKLINAKIYEHRFAGHIDAFVQRRSELQSMITSYTSAGVDFANMSLIAVGHKLSAMDSKLDTIFRALDTPREKDALKFIEDNGGAEKCIIKEELLQRLLVRVGEVSQTAKNTAIQREELTELRQTLIVELSDNVEQALAKNQARFEKLLAVQNINLERISGRIEEQGVKMQGHDMKLDKLVSTSLLILEEGRLVKKAIVPSSTIKLKDPELQQIWDRMGLKRSVKATTFVLTFRDHILNDRSTTNTPYVPPLSPLHPESSPFLLSTDDVSTGEKPLANMGTGKDADIWLLKYIDVTHVRPIVEAIDEDGSGFISVKEANKFAISRPTGWSLLRWMAYWAAGWHFNITNYRNKIYSLIHHMYEALDSVLPVNRYFTNQYFDHTIIFHYVEGMLKATNPLPEDSPKDSKLLELVKEMTDLTERRISTNLKGVSFIIKSPSDVALIVGSGRVETWIFPLLYLLLSRHLEIIRLAQHVVLDPNEMTTHTESLSSIFSVFNERVKRLEAIFRQMYRDVEAQFKSYAYGMFLASYKDYDIKMSENTLLTHEVKESDMTTSFTDTVDRSILTQSTLPTFEYEEINIPSLPPLEGRSQHAIEGTWVGVCTGKDGSKLTHNVGFEVVLGPIVENKLIGKGRNISGAVEFDGHIESSEVSSNPVPIFFRISWVGRDQQDVWCSGVYDPECQSIRGAWLFQDISTSISFPFCNTESRSDAEDLVNDSSVGLFYMTKGSSDIFRFQYLLDDPDINPSWSPSRKRWAFATQIIVFQIQRQRSSWTFWRARIAECKRLAELFMRTWLETPDTRGYISEGEVVERLRLFGYLHPSISNLTMELASYYMARYVFAIGNAVCDVCSQYIIFTRFVCITCVEEIFNNEVDMCAECIDSTEFTNENEFIHHPSHTLLRFTRRFHYCQRVVIIPHARLLSARIQASFKASGMAGAKTSRSTSDIGKSAKGDTDNVVMSRPSLVELICACCGKDLTLPCWACAACDLDILICLGCEREGRQVQNWEASSKHLRHHPLLRISHTEEVKTNELKTTRLEKNLQTTMDTVTGLEQKVNLQFQEMKTLLDQVARSPKGAND
ncbi:hypothetical protein CPB84DRAFT_751308 [Gymnopilus junonius]|uniref:EF-hand domain-containing protein n=1 Tax=Gymnopilus junonius TaxID=109634 RepID=A0A9P5P2L0_GYMJU|nr:hypothetical protein CPB84DRAFT_751308 [Gymnopilus junonius]